MSGSRATETAVLAHNQVQYVTEREESNCKGFLSTDQKHEKRRKERKKRVATTFSTVNRRHVTKEIEKGWAAKAL